MLNTLIVLLCAFLSSITLEAQSYFTPDDHLINGYTTKITGLDFEYHSCIPGLRQSILVRATNGKDLMEWETDPVPGKISCKYATFIWIAAIGSGPGKARMDLSVNGIQSFSFYTDTRPAWDIEGPDGSLLSFRSIMIDQHGDHHGYMIMRLPADKVRKGEPVRIKVTGSAANLSSWYMTFKKVVKTGVTLTPYPAILKNNEDPVQLVEASVFFFDEETDARIFANGKLLNTAHLVFGYNAIRVGLPAVSKPTNVKLRVEAGTYQITNTVTLYPVR